MFLPMPIVPPIISNLDFHRQESPSVLQRQTIQFDREFRAEAPSIQEDLEEGKTKLSGGVIAWYGTTTIRCENLVIDRINETAVATGSVSVEDPLGSIKSQSFQIDWSEGAKTGTANNVELQIGYVQISSQSVSTTPNLWVLNNAVFTLEDTDGKRNRLIAETVQITPGKRGVAKRVFVYVLGQRIGPFGSLDFNLDNRVSGFKLPSITSRPGVGLGISWDSSFLIGKQSAIGGNLSIFPRITPSYSLSYTSTTLNTTENATKLEVQDDLGERFRDGWFNNIGIGKPEDDWISTGEPRRNFTVKSSWNTGTSARIPNGSSVSKAIDFGYEWSDKTEIGNLRMVGHLQRVREESGAAWIDRSVISSTLAFPVIELGNSLKFHSRFDFTNFLSPKNNYGFGRIEIGLVTPKIGGFRFGGAWVGGQEYGTPDFDFDRLVLKNGVLLRADYLHGPYTLRYLAKYDLDRGYWLDREWEVALAAGPFEPYILRREFPQDYRFGIRFRLDDFVQRLQGNTNIKSPQ